MKNKYIILLILFISSIFLFTSCEDVVNVEVQKSGNTQLTVDGFIDNQLNKQQVIKLSLTQPYFENSATKPALGATVFVFDQDSTRFEFKDLKNDGNYTWTPKANQSFGKINYQYSLYVKYNSEEFVSLSKMNRVPKIDSIAYEFNDTRQRNQGTKGPESGYQPEFYGRDFPGEGDCYWIRSAKNGKYFNDASAITVAYDAAMNPGGNIDGLIFIQPIRRSIAKELFLDKDTLSVDLYSITPETFYFFKIVQQQAQNGGIFATPTSNVPTNIVNRNTNSSQKALGFFNVSAVSTFKAVIDKTKARPKTN
jgi:hypothetical protein